MSRPVCRDRNGRRGVIDEEVNTRLRVSRPRDAQQRLIRERRNGIERGDARRLEAIEEPGMTISEVECSVDTERQSLGIPEIRGEVTEVRVGMNLTDRPL